MALCTGEIEHVISRVIGAAIEVHRELGPGFLESMYEAALCSELDSRGIGYVRQLAVPIQYKGVPLGEARLDLFVEGALIVELKAVEQLAPIHVAQVVSYLRAMRLPLGLLINFNVALLRSGIRRVIFGRGLSATEAL